MRDLVPCLWVLAFLAAPARAQTPEPVSLPVVLHVLDGADETRVAALVDTLTESYAPAGITFAVERRVLAEDRRWLHTIRERRALARLLVPYAINVFLVDHADDPHPSESTRRTAASMGFTPSGHLGGAHIPAPGHHPGTYVIVTFDGSRTTLAHEIGHVLGSGHSADPESIMSYGRDRHRFDERTLGVLRARAQRYLRTRELRPFAARRATIPPTTSAWACRAPSTSTSVPSEPMRAAVRAMLHAPHCVDCMRGSSGVRRAARRRRAHVAAGGGGPRHASRAFVAFLTSA